MSSQIHSSYRASKSLSRHQHQYPARDWSRKKGAYRRKDKRRAQQAPSWPSRAASRCISRQRAKSTSLGPVSIVLLPAPVSRFPTILGNVKSRSERRPNWGASEPSRCLGAGGAHGVDGPKGREGEEPTSQLTPEARLRGVLRTEEPYQLIKPKPNEARSASYSVRPDSLKTVVE